MTDPSRALAEELHQSRPFESREEEVVVSVLRTAAVLRRALAEAVEGSGLSPAQYNVLRILRGAGEEGLPTLAVRDRLLEEAPGVTRLIDKLEGAGHVRRDRSGRDRRTVRCVITPSGLALLDALEPRLRAMRASAVPAALADDAQRALLTHLAALRAALAAR